MLYTKLIPLILSLGTSAMVVIQWTQQTEKLSSGLKTRSLLIGSQKWQNGFMNKKSPELGEEYNNEFK